MGYSRAVNWTVIALLLLSEGGATILFLVPIYKSRFSDARKLALRSSISSIASMLSSLGHVSGTPQLGVWLSALTCFPAQYLYLPIAGGAVQAWIYALISIADGACLSSPPLRRTRLTSRTLDSHLQRLHHVHPHSARLQLIRRTHRHLPSGPLILGRTNEQRRRHSPAFGTHARRAGHGGAG